MLQADSFAISPQPVCDLVERARAGDLAACEALISEVLLSRIYRIAFYYVRVYGWSSRALEALDIAQDACEYIYERLAAALSKENPIAYLLVAARNEIRRRCERAASETCISLDAPVSDESETPLHEFIPAESGPQDEKDYQALYRALAALPEKQRVILEHRYGLNTHAPLDAVQTSKVTGINEKVVRYCEHAALASLFFLLRNQLQADHLPLTAADRRSPHPAKLQSQDARKRLDAAYQQLQATGKITVEALRKTARVSGQTAWLYLHEREPQRRQRAVERQELLLVPARERLDAAYRQLQATGCKITTEALRKTARVDKETACSYLRECSSRQAVVSIPGGTNPITQKRLAGGRM